MDQKTKKSQQRSKAIKQSAVWSRQGTAKKNKKETVLKTRLAAKKAKKKTTKVAKKK